MVIDNVPAKLWLRLYGNYSKSFQNRVRDDINNYIMEKVRQRLGLEAL